MTTGERLAFYRKKSAMTQQQLGEQLNVSAQAVSKWENDQSEPDIATLCKMAEIYRVSVDELVGAEVPQQSAPQEGTTVVAPVVMPVVVTASQQPKKPNPVAKFLKKFWWLFVVVAVLAVAAIVFINVWNAFEPDRMLEKFNQVDLGMTREEVEAIMGEPEEIKSEASSQEDDDGIWGKYMQWDRYGYENRDYEYWYYRDAQYEKTEKATQKANEELDFGYKPEPWTQIRFVFDEDGELIEAYYNAAFSGGYQTAYGDTEKVCTEVIPLQRMPYYETTENYASFKVEAHFEDGSIYIGTLDFSKSDSKPADGGRTMTADRWGTVHVVLPYAPVGTHFPEE